MEVKKSYNYGIAFAKAFLSFSVVCCHYWHSDNPDYYLVSAMYRIRAVAVPIFMIMSFFLAEKMFVDTKVHKMKERVWRLLFPYITWAVLYYLGYRVIDALLKFAGFSQGLGIEYTYIDLLWQIVFGSDRYLCPQLWYLFDLIVLTVVFGVIFLLCNKYSWHIIIVLGIVALGIQYFGINYRLFGGYEYELRYSLGRIAEVFPLACIGLLLAHSKVLERIKKEQIWVTLICIVTMLIIAYGGLFTSPEKGFGYGGTYIIAYSTIAFILFYVVPFDKMWISIRKIVRFLSKYSFGVFCIHFGVGYCWNKVFCVYFEWEQNTFWGCIGIYMICIFVSWIISRVPMKYAKQLVE